MQEASPSWDYIKTLSSWDYVKTAPMAMSLVLTCKVNGQSKQGTYSTGAVDKASLSYVNACYYHLAHL